MVKTIAHLSDLHIGRSTAHHVAAVSLCDALLAHKVDQVLVTGDITHHGLVSEFNQFTEIFQDLLSSNKMFLVPGNHDRLGDDVSLKIMAGNKVSVFNDQGLHIISIDSTGSHNRAWVSVHGVIGPEDVENVGQMLDQARDHDLVVVLLHHHLLPLPEDTFWERLVAWLGWQFTLELRNGKDLIKTLIGRCDLILHGHRHIPRERYFAEFGRDLLICNAGSSTAMKKFRLFTHENGKLISAPVWISV